MKNDSLSNVSLSDFRSNPFCPARTIDALMGAGYHTLSDVVSMTEEAAMSIRGFGKGKVAQVMNLAEMIRTGSEDLVDYYENNLAVVELPSDACAPLADRISELLSSLSGILENAGKRDLAVICRYGLLENRSVAELLDDRSLGLTICRERVRQEMVWLRRAIWTNGLGKYRVRISDSFLDGVALMKCDCTGKPLSVLKSRIGQGATGHGYTNFFGLDVVSRGSYACSAIDEDYVIEAGGNIRIFLDGMWSVQEVLRKDVRPMAFEDICAELPEMESGRISSLLSSNPRFEYLGNGIWQMAYRYLCDYECAARLVWEKKNLHYSEVDMLHAVRTGDYRGISNSLAVAQRKYPWCRPVGKSGRWEYGESASSRRNILAAIESYVENHEVFSFSKAMKSLEKKGFGYPERTVRSYFVSKCRVSKANPDLLCSIEKAASHPEVSWRRKVVPGTTDWVLENAVRILSEYGSLRMGRLIDGIMARDKEGRFSRRSIEAALYQNDREGLGIFLKDSDGRVSLSPECRDMNTAMSVIDGRKSIPAHYEAVLAVIKEKLAQSNEGICSLASLRDACSGIIAPFAKVNTFYKIVADHTPLNVEKVRVNGEVFLRQIA